MLQYERQPFDEFKLQEAISKLRHFSALKEEEQKEKGYHGDKSELEKQVRLQKAVPFDLALYLLKLTKDQLFYLSVSCPKLLDPFSLSKKSLTKKMDFKIPFAPIL